MIEEELEKKAKEWYSRNYDEWAEGEDSFALEEELIEAYIEGVKQNSIMWHDLRKNPEDLPKEDCETITIHVNGNKNIQKWKNGNWTNAIIIPIVAWCEIPKFEGE